MCRWVVYIGQQPLMLEDLLIRPKHSIVKQVSERFIPGLYYGLEEDDVEELKKQATWINVHGFGVSWYTNTLTEFDPSIKGMLPAQFRTIAPISTDLAFAQLCGHTASTCTLAHIRDASFPPVVEVNNHPFIFGKYTFMHNGSVESFRKIRFDVMRRIFDLQTVVQTNQYKSSVQDSNYVFGILGNTDTEHLATLYFAHLDIIRATKPSFGADSTDALLLALIETIADIHTIQFQHQVGPFTPGPGAERVGNALNLCITDGGVQMLVSRWRDSKEGYPRSLYLSLNAGEKLNRKYYPDLPDPTTSEDVNNTDVKIDSVRELVARHKPTQQGRHVIVGSEPCTRYVQDWGLFDQNQCVTVDNDRNLRLINLAKFFQSGREHEFEAYQFTEVIDKIKKSKSTRTGTIGIPAHAIDLPKSKSDAFETEFNLDRASSK
ncbi:hypothetical protein GGU10DRAFT_42533 [Lentinula aff. detonsa]|uniref:Glutamine amidotransferase type-2 domain-containing protein n=1 Tax=Lentinula aff. detonsa TaxID=2804958 RepID=A0AA38KN69_9AGAR|nr:hypothetical protein GGU10DRAFT_42533 [Lentinula aff. detonsa]